MIVFKRNIFTIILQALGMIAWHLQSVSIALKHLCGYHEDLPMCATMFMAGALFCYD